MTTADITDLAVSSAITPTRVMVLNEDEQRLLIGALSHNRTDHPAMVLLGRLLYGDEYSDEADELVRTTLRKRQLEAAVRQATKRIEDLEPDVIENLQEAGLGGGKHQATGATLVISRKVYAKVIKEGDKVTPDEKARAAQALIDAGLGEFVRPDFNTNTVSAHFRQLVNDHDAEQKDLPEHQRQPRAAASFLPVELSDVLELTDAPALSVRA